MEVKAKWPFSLQQACRGDKHDDPVIVQDTVDGREEAIVNETEVDAAGVYTLPAGADFLMCYSVAQGKVLIFYMGASGTSITSLNTSSFCSQNEYSSRSSVLHIC